MNKSIRVIIITAALGAAVGVLCDHFGFSAIERWTCVISVAVIVGAII